MRTLSNQQKTGEGNCTPEIAEGIPQHEAVPYPRPRYSFATPAYTQKREKHKTSLSPLCNRFGDQSSSILSTATPL